MVDGAFFAEIWVRAGNLGLVGPEAGASRLGNLKETAAGLRRAQRDPHPVHLRPRRNAVLVAGDKAGQWDTWYRQAIPLAEQRYGDYLKQEGIR